VGRFASRARRFVAPPAAPGRVLILGFAFLALLLCIPSRASADVGVVLNESLDISMDRITGSGHSAVYFSRICADTPVRLRLCRPGEAGSVLSTYTNLGEDQRFEWNVAPLNIYLYGVEDPQNRPLFGSPKIKRALDERYRQNYLADYCTTQSCRTGDAAEWRYMVAATLSRGVYIFIVETSLQQDREFIERFNAQPNVNHFNGVTNNCADFAMRVINSYFPRAAKTSYLNDFGMTSPKAISRSFTRYALKHPEAHLRVLHFAQVPGTIKRSSEVHSGTEQLYHSKKLLLPMAIWAPHELAFVAGSYLLTGRFNPQRETEKYPTIEATDTAHELKLARAENDPQRERDLQDLLRAQREEVAGTPREWKAFAVPFDAIVDAAVRDEVIPDRDYLNRVFKRLDKASEPVVESNGTLWLETSPDSGALRVGVSASNILAPGSDSVFACQLVLARTAYELKAPKHGRETMQEFRAGWALLGDARLRNSPALAGTNTTMPSPSAVHTAPGAQQ
jgi:hypothetical protein